MLGFVNRILYIRSHTGMFPQWHITGRKEYLFRNNMNKILIILRQQARLSLVTRRTQRALIRVDLVKDQMRFAVLIGLLLLVVQSGS